jgi:hypothetical protein
MARAVNSRCSRNAPLPMTAKDIVQPRVTRRVVPMCVAPCPEFNLLPMHTSVSMTVRRKRALGRELRDIVFRLCSVAGVTLGMLWDLHHPKYAQRPSNAACGHTARHIVASHIGHCIGNEVSSGPDSLAGPDRHRACGRNVRGRRPCVDDPPRARPGSRPHASSSTPLAHRCSCVVVSRSACASASVKP